ncbi:NADH-quinone oxidoreductase subunit M [Steroidobacter denitrificans]|uniref:NADH-quinone oxidoreductase subunit M n=1 Tax=Steroidobacter denitrificans TaxID=465721 RepID=A0A127F8U1_STEDE|nr:NADH-quinone oxidoreductase subunit M [Steroidobacter denitrificans]AMN46837.1 NADH-quinone oxidoreductase subunit M [Steroidobacter denitrificans]
MQLEWPILSVLIWLPILGGLLMLALGDRGIALGRWVGLLTTLATFAISTLLYTNFDASTAQMQFVEERSWIPVFNIWYALGIDGISLPLILLTTFVTPLCVIAGWSIIEKKPGQYFASFLLMEGLMIGVFAALDAMLFYVLWEAMLIPMFIIIGIWGGPRRVYATLKFFLYTFLGSVLMLVSLIYMYLQSCDLGQCSYSIADFQRMPLGLNEQILIFLSFFAAFAVKVPMWPVHTWLPDAHVEAPTGGSVILAAILLKMGGYGFLRFALPITPDASATLDWLIISLSLIAIVYIGFVAIVQQDMKKLIAYSSVAHMGFVTLGAFLTFELLRVNGDVRGAAMGLDGAMVQMVSHGLISGAMFFCMGVLYDRMHTREISAYGGVVNTMPVFATFAVLFSFANSGLPGTSGFVAEFLVIIASFRADFWYAFFAAVTLILGAAYSLWLVKRVIFGPVKNENVAAMQDVNAREFIVLGVLAVAVLLLGVWPAPLLDVMRPTIENLVQQITISKL